MITHRKQGGDVHTLSLNLVALSILALSCGYLTQTCVQKTRKPKISRKEQDAVMQTLSPDSQNDQIRAISFKTK
jgi:hypothetical protein